MSKRFEVTCCTWCPNMADHPQDKKCMAMEYKPITREDELVLDSEGNAMESKTPDWCPLEDY